MALPHPARPSASPAPWLPIAVVLLAASGTGCTSALSTSYLRDALLDSTDHAAEAVATAGADDASEPATDDTDAERRRAAVEEAETRLARLGPLDEATRRSLVETLHRTQQEDWPAVIDAFATSLEETPATSPAPVPPVEAAEPHVVAKADLDQASPAAAAPTPAAATVSAATVVSRAETPAAAAPAPTVPAPAHQAGPVPTSTPVRPALAVQNACFASRVQGWGLVERFPADRFRTGQEVIVYFELDNLSSEAAGVGHTTCIDTELRLVAADGTLVKAWSFEPIAETCRVPRHDYFARYVVTIPAACPGGDARLELVVTDTLSGTAATATVPLEVVSAD